MKSNRISVLHFSNEFVRGGAEQHMLTLLCGLSRRYFDLHLVCTPQLAQLLKPDLPPDVEMLPLLLRKPWQLNVALELAEILRSRQVDILHSHIFYASLFASPVAWSCSVPIVIETPHVREYWRRGRFTSRYIVDRLVGHCVNRYIAVSEANGRYLAEEKGLPNQKISVIHNGSDLKRFHHVRCKSEGLRQKLGFRKEELILLVAGRLEPQKGHAVLLTALPFLWLQTTGNQKDKLFFPKTELLSIFEPSDLQRTMKSLNQRSRCDRDFLVWQSLLFCKISWFRLGNCRVM